VADCRLIKLLRWRTRLLPLSPPKIGTLASSPVLNERDIRKREVV
jgi:hypothetical protein